MAYINNFIAVVKLSKAQNMTICGYYTDNYENGKPRESGVYDLITVGYLHYSRDGEVRKVTIQSSVVDNILKDPLFEDMEDGILPFISDMELSTLFYFPKGTPTKVKEHFKKHVKNNRYDIAIAVMHIYSILESQTFDPTPDSLSFDIIADRIDDLAVVKKMIDDKSHTKNALSLGLIGKYSSQRTVFVTKIVPLTIAESQNIEDIRYRAWREYYVQTISQFMLATRITDNFTKYLPWRMLHNIDEDMFQNPSILSKFRYGNVIDKFRQQITSLQNLPSMANKIAISTPDTSREEFDTVLQYSSDNLKLSKFAIVYYSLQISRPLYMSIAELTADNVNQLIFHWLYAFLVMHAIIGAIHTDAHAGNLHIRSAKILSPIIIDDVIYRSLKPVRGIIIDFSRSIINPYHPIVGAYAKTISPDLLAGEQGELLLRFYMKCFPKARNIDAIVAMIKSDFDKSFRILSLLDPIFALNEIRRSVTNAEMLNFIDTILVKCTEVMNAGIADISTVSDYPLKKILKENFGMNAIQPIEKQTAITYNDKFPFEFMAHKIKRFDASVDDEENILSRY